MISRRMFMRSVAVSLLGAPVAIGAVAGADPVHVQVFRSPDCDCCGAWIAHLEEHGFLVDVVMSADVDAVKDRHAVPPALRSCHTGLVQGYVIEGHVPAEAIRRLLDQRPQSAGLAVPGMPIGAPGMEMGDQRDPFDVILWGGLGRGSDTEIFASY